VRCPTRNVLSFLPLLLARPPSSSSCSLPASALRLLAEQEAPLLVLEALRANPDSLDVAVQTCTALAPFCHSGLHRPLVPRYRDVLLPTSLDISRGLAARSLAYMLFATRHSCHSEVTRVSLGTAGAVRDLMGVMRHFLDQLPAIREAGLCLESLTVTCLRDDLFPSLF